MSPAIVDVLVDVVRAVIEDLGLAVVGPKSHVLVKYCCLADPLAYQARPITMEPAGAS